MNHEEKCTCEACKALDVTTPLGTLQGRMLPITSVMINICRGCGLSPKEGILTAFLFATFAALQGIKPPLSRDTFLESAGKVFDLGHSLLNDPEIQDLIKQTKEQRDLEKKEGMH